MAATGGGLYPSCASTRFHDTSGEVGHQSEGNEIYKVVGGRLRLRTGPGTGYKTLKLLPDRTEVIILTKPMMIGMG